MFDLLVGDGEAHHFEYFDLIERSFFNKIVGNFVFFLKMDEILELDIDKLTLLSDLFLDVRDRRVQTFGRTVGQTIIPIHPPLFF